MEADGVALLAGKTVLVTGASAGIGRAAAIGAARHGADVAINFARDEDGAQSAVAEIEALGRRAIHVQGDVADPATATDFIARAVGSLGKVDVFVNNAGICPFHAFLDMPVETFERTMRVNLHGAYFMVQAAANQMVRQGNGGSIVAVSSISALVGGEYQTHYTPTKAGVHSLMQSTAIALGKYGIRCNSVLPGTILTDINKDDLADQAKRQRMEARIPLGRLGEPDDLAGPIVFLASDLARYVTGAALLVDGGAFVNLQ
jgi:L-rhamnose 1-dehydrogenase